MTINQALLWAQKKLQSSSDSPELDGEVLLSHILNKPREYLYANPKKKLTHIQYSKFHILIRRRANHWPVAYLTGHKEFYGLDFKVAPDVLIPRPETELLVELAIQYSKFHIPHSIIDIGTGSGCIIISIAKKLAEYGRSVYQTPYFFGTDISDKALRIAKQNARKHKVASKIKFLRGNLLPPSFPLMPARLWREGGGKGGHSLIIANLPYLTTKQLAEPSIKHEPKQALHCGPDGLKYFRSLFQQISEFGILNSTFYLEHDPSQKTKLKVLAKSYFPKTKVKFHRDLSRKYRILELNL